MYKIVGADGRQYGSVNEDQIRRWIAEGRANAQTQVLAEGAMQWRSLGTLPEFAAAFGPQAPPTIIPVSGSHLRKTNAFAVWGMILGILALVFCLCCCVNIPIGTLGLIFSIIGLVQISNRADVYEGRCLAIAGVILSTLGLLAGISLVFAQVLHGNYHSHNYWHMQHF
jgi:hypothetical protein